MPTYDYECTKCGNKFEKFQMITAEPVKRCPACKGKVNRLIGAGAGIIFKGSGFYATDYRKKEDKKASCPMDKNRPACSSCDTKKE